MSKVTDAVTLLKAAGITFRVGGDDSVIADTPEELSPNCVVTLEALKRHTVELLLVLQERDGDLPLQDSYAASFLSAVRSAIPEDCPPGLLPWLREKAPSLYATVIQGIPDRIQAMWAGGAPLRDFDDATDQLTVAFRRAIGFYRACHRE